MRSFHELSKRTLDAQRLRFTSGFGEKFKHSVSELHTEPTLPDREKDPVASQLLCVILDFSESGTGSRLRQSAPVGFDLGVTHEFTKSQDKVLPPTVLVLSRSL